MAGLNRTAQEFLHAYEQQYQQVKNEAELARDLVAEIARSTGVLMHAVTARAKTPDSLRGKLCRKHYRNPDRQVTDLVGIRVITFYSDDVDTVVDRLRHSLEINKAESVDKRAQLGLREFGYRSVQLIVRLKAPLRANKKFQILKNRWFEIQVRSILEHAWAEISHEIVYKSGVKYPEEVVRRFATLAGTLELLDDEFLELRDERSELIDQYRAVYGNGDDDRKSFDVARLLGFLEAVRPMGLSWRQAAEKGTPFDYGLDTSCVNALKAVGLGTPRSLKALIRSDAFVDAISSLAESHGVTSEKVSHPAVVVLALVVKDADEIYRHFPELAFDPAIAKLIRQRVSK